jgi:hypothetical protein
MLPSFAKQNLVLKIRMDTDFKQGLRLGGRLPLRIFCGKPFAYRKFPRLFAKNLCSRYNGA